MSFNWQGFILVLLTLIFVTGQIVSHNWIKKVTNCYFFWAGVGILCFVWLMVFRFVPQMSDCWWALKNGAITDPSDYSQSFRVSKGLLLDICPLCGFLMPIACFADPTRKAARIIAPTSLLAGAITIGSFVADPSAALTAQFIFFGIEPNKCYFIMHFIQIVLAVGIMLNTPKYTFKGWVCAIVFPLLLYTYVGICKSITGIRWFVSGLDYNDWSPQGEYHAVSEILHIPYKVCPYIGIPFMLCVGCGIVALRDKVFDRCSWFKYGNGRNNKVVTFKIGKKQIKMKQWWFWYDYNKFEEPKWF